MNSKATLPPVFIVGPSRSGTGLMRRCLSRHPDLYVVGETHYFDDLRIKLGGDGTRPLTPAEQRRCQDYFLALGHLGYGKGGDADQSRHSRADLIACAEKVGTGADAYFEAFCKLEAAANGKRHWGEKTPRHVMRIDELLARFPDAKIICMVRDPRAVVVSRRDGVRRQSVLAGEASHATMQERRKARSYDALVNALVWRSVVNAARAAVRTHGDDRVRLQPFEDLVRDAERTVPHLAAWLGLQFDESMLDVPHANSSYTSSRRHQGFVAAPVDRWRQQLSGSEIAVIQSACRAQMRALNYELAATGAGRIAVPAAWARLPFTAARATAANASRSGSIPRYVWRRLRATVRA